MKDTAFTQATCISFGVAAAVLLSLCLLTTNGLAQTGAAGNNAVYNSSSQPQGSSAFIDASVFSATNQDICTTLYNIIHGPLYPAFGTTIDARGINASNSKSSGGKMQCAGTPWLSGSGGSTNNPATILLPSGTIVISSPWILPTGSRVIGQGAGNLDTTPPATIPTVLEAGFSTGPMIEMGYIGTPSGYSSAPCPNSNPCRGVAIENLLLNGVGSGVGGIANTNSQELSYVDHVTIYQALGLGLQITGSALGSAQNSGPYTNITYDTGTDTGSSGCAAITSLGGTRGIHGLTCITPNYSPVAVYLDASNNSLEDVRIIGFEDGVLVGSQAGARSNVLFNVFGDTMEPRILLFPINVIHVSVNFPVTDLSVVGTGNAGGIGTLTIKDDVTGTNVRDVHVAMYVLGKPAIGASGYSRFSTSPNEATWAVGNVPLTQGTACAALGRGSLYSNTSTNGAALWVCALSSSMWQAVK